MDVKSVSIISVKSLSLSLILLSFSFIQVFSQDQKSEKKKFDNFTKKENPSEKELLAFDDGILTSDEELDLATSYTLQENFVRENELNCDDEYFRQIMEDLLVATNDSFLFNSFDFNGSSLNTDDQDENVTGLICEEDKFIFLNDSQMVIPMEYLTANEYYSIWDSQNINPYEYELKNFNDTIQLKLFEDENWSPPIKSTEVNSKYGLRRWRWHHGTDLDLERGDSVYAAFDGIVRIAKYNWGGYGYYVMLRHKNGLETLYGHLTKYLVKVGQEVKAGELIGWGGSTGRSSGPHLHFETRYKGHAFDPTHLYDFSKDTLLFSNFEITAKRYEGLMERSKSVYHRLRSGDTLSGLAVRYSTTITRICRLNGIRRSTILRIGRSLRIR